MTAKTLPRIETRYKVEAKLFKTLMHPARLAILSILREGEACVCHMEAALGYRQAYISQQLMVLRDAGLVEDRRDGWNVFYHVIRPQVFAVLDAAGQATGLAGMSSTSNIAAVRLENCSCPNCCPDGSIHPPGNPGNDWRRDSDGRPGLDLGGQRPGRARATAAPARNDPCQRSRHA
jgi:DNA-binding transcriptional ArsR family regulator